jgi:hypothetical protein
MYKTGGLEITDEPITTLSVDGTNYVTSEKFKTSLRDSFIDWGTFIEIYQNNISDDAMFEQVVKILNIKNNEHLTDMMLPLVKKIYSLPASAHMSCMMKQYMLYEPVSLAIHSLFTVIKKHYEEILSRFITSRNIYIIKNKTNDLQNSITELYNNWNDLNDQYDLDSSSVQLLFLNPSELNSVQLDENSTLHIEVKDIHETKELAKAIEKFHYKGFCHRDPYKRLSALLEFPLDEFINAIEALEDGSSNVEDSDKGSKSNINGNNVSGSVEDNKSDKEDKGNIDGNNTFPDYEKIEKEISKILANKNSKPDISDTYERKTLPKTDDDSEQIKWYVDEILNLRKSLLPYGKKIEKYYDNEAKMILEITDLIKKEFSNVDKN